MGGVKLEREIYKIGRNFTLQKKYFYLKKDRYIFLGIYMINNR